MENTKASKIWSLLIFTASIPHSLFDCESGFSEIHRFTIYFENTISQYGISWPILRAKGRSDNFLAEIPCVTLSASVFERVTGKATAFVQHCQPRVSSAFEEGQWFMAARNFVMTS